MLKEQKYKEDEVTLKELVLSAIEWKNHILSSWKIIVLVGVIGSLIGLSYSFYAKPVYKAELTFVLEEGGKSGGISAYAGLASQFGLNLGGLDGADNLFAGDNIMELMRSRSILQNTLLSKVSYKGKPELLINIYIESKELKEKWAKSPETASLNFPIDIDKEKLSLKQDSVLGKICQAIREKNLTVEKVDKKLSIMTVRCKINNELFAKLFTEKLLQNVSNFYIETKTKKARENVQLLEDRTDSVKRELDKALYGTAAMADQNVNLVSQTANLGRVKKQRDAQVLGAMYTELVKNLEIARFALMREQPLVQIVDNPVLPLEKEKIGKMKAMFFGGALAGLLIVIMIVLIRLYKQVMLLAV